MNSIEEMCISESQRTDSHYYDIAVLGNDPTTGESDKPALQRYAARRSRQTRSRLISLIESREAGRAALKEMGE